MALHPFISAMLDSLKDAPALSAGTPQDARAFVAAGTARLGKGPELHRVEDVSIQGRSGPVAARVLLPQASPDGVIVYLHGGGWVIGALDDFDTYTRTLAQRTGFAVVAVDYRLAPEHPYPAGLEDCEDALAAVVTGKLESMPSGPIVVMGDSAGGNLATVCCARLEDTAKVALQVLYYPVTDMDFDRESYAAHGRGLPLTGGDMKWFFAHYAPRDIWSDPAISPLKQADPSRLPPAIIVTAEYDVLRDEGEAYAAHLRDAGVEVRHRRLGGVTHGFIRLHPLFDVADEELSTISAEIRDLAT